MEHKSTLANEPLNQCPRNTQRRANTAQKVRHLKGETTSISKRPARLMTKKFTNSQSLSKKSCLTNFRHCQQATSSESPNEHNSRAKAPTLEPTLCASLSGRVMSTLESQGGKLEDPYLSDGLWNIFPLHSSILHVVSSACATIQ